MLYDYFLALINQTSKTNKPMEGTSTITNLSKYGHCHDGKVFLKAYREFPERQIGEVKTTEEAALLYFQNRFEHIKSKVTELVTAIGEASNKGSYLMKLLHLREKLGSYDALGDFPPLFDQLEEAENQIRGLIAVNRVKNLEIKTALLAELQVIVDLEQVPNWGDTSQQVKDIKERWLKTGSVNDEEDDAIEQQFTAMLDAFYERRKVYYDARMVTMHENVAKYTELVERSIKLKDEPSSGQAMRAMKAIMIEWREIGNVPKQHYKPLQSALKRVQRELQRRAKLKQEARGLKGGMNPPPYVDPIQQENIRKREEMITQLEDLEKNPDTRTSFGIAKEMQLKWKEMPLAPAHVKDDLNRRFTYLCDRIFEKSYLMRNIYINYKFFNSKSIIEQLSLKISMLQGIILKDDEENEALKDQFFAMPEDVQRSPENKPTYGKIKTQERKLAVKKELLKEMQAELAAL